MINGIINVYKEEGFTSHDVVAKLRGILKFRHIGHTGTLDPMAVGVLPVCIGSATKLCDMLTDKIKVYEAECLFGKSTDTLDITGQVLMEKEVNFSYEELRKACDSLTGDIMQLPPMYSAIKVNGKKLYEIARAGKEVEVEKRPVTIYSIEIVDTTLVDQQITEARLLITCGKGTYIRSICRDLGEMLGSCACMKSLIRKKSGDFEISDSLTLAQIEKARDEDRLQEVVFPIDRVFSDKADITTLPEFDSLLYNGNYLRRSEVKHGRVEPHDILRAYDSKGDFYGLYEFDGEKGKFKPYKMFM